MVIFVFLLTPTYAIVGVAVNRDDDVAMEVDAIVHRVSDSTLVEDKRAAIEELRNVLQDNPRVRNLS